ncbi:hypothetical protein MMC14_008644 [Varicellaria rhodocarpa]|nr:hypothetical protein [Varicellaria rhodocarpa]
MEVSVGLAGPQIANKPRATQNDVLEARQLPARKKPWGSYPKECLHDLDIVYATKVTKGIHRNSKCRKWWQWEEEQQKNAPHVPGLNGGREKGREGGRE